MLCARAPGLRPRPLDRLYLQGAIDTSAAINSSTPNGASRRVASSEQYQQQPALVNGFFHIRHQQGPGMPTPAGNNQPSTFNLANKKIVDGGVSGGGSSGTRVQGKSSPSSTQRTETPSPRSDASPDSSFSSFAYSCPPSPSAAAPASSIPGPSCAFPTPTSPPPSQFRLPSLSASKTSTTSTTSPFSLPTGALSGSSVPETRAMLPDPDMQYASGREEVGRVASVNSKHDGKRIIQVLRSERLFMTKLYR